MTEHQMDVDAVVFDPETHQVGEYRGRSGPYAMLRPLGGGREWQADPGAIRPATREERLSASLRAANHRSGLDLLPATTFPSPPAPVPGCATCDELATLRCTSRAEGDRSRETDANVLLRRHQRQAHPGDGESTTPARRRIFRYVPYSIVQDGSAEPEYEARCVSGDEDDCGAVSGRHPDPAKVEEWQRRHTQETRHTRYRRCFADYSLLEPQAAL